MGASERLENGSGSRRSRSARTAAVLSVLGLLVTASVAHAAGSAPAKTEIAAYPATISMANDRISHWAPVVATFGARKAPRGAASLVQSVPTVTGDGTQNIVEILSQTRVGSQIWYQVRLASLPNSQTGWARASALGTVYTVNTHLYVNRSTYTATLKRNGTTIFTTRVGVGRSYWPTPAGQFYIRDKLTNFDNPFYGPIAFGTSARSNVLTDWPGGGYVGVHGTNEPGILPGAVSHGCIRMLNSAIEQLAKLMPVGTPLTVT